MNAISTNAVTTNVAAPATATASNITATAFKALPFDGFVFFNIECCVYTARKRLTPADLDLDEKELPPATLASLGSMHSADPKQLIRFESFRGAMRAACLVYGVRCLGGFAVPSAKAPEVAVKLDELVAEFYDAKSKFLKDFEASRESWLTRPEFAQWTDKIRARLDSVTHVDRQLQASWQAFTLGPLSDLPKGEDEAESALAAGVKSACMSLEGTAISELVVMAKSLVEKSLYDENGHVRAEVTQKILSPIRKILEKADALSFAAPRLRHVVDYGRSILIQLPTKGKLRKESKEMVFALAYSLCNPESIIRSAEVASADDVTLSDEDSVALQALHAPTLDDDAPVQVVEDLFPVSDGGASDPDAIAGTIEIAGMAEGDVVYDL